MARLIALLAAALLELGSGAAAHAHALEPGYLELRAVVNAGVEAGQLLFIAAALTLMAVARRVVPDPGQGPEAGGARWRRATSSVAPRRTG